ncbi:hypothetical protein JCM17380_15450 [Desulfosporosinus burensis]
MVFQTSVAIILLTSFLILFFVIRIFLESKKEAVISSILFTAGLELTISSFGTMQDKILPAIALISKNMTSQDTTTIISEATQTNYNQLITGLILLGLGIALTYYSRKKLYILNIMGYEEKRIENYSKDLGLSAFDFKERDIDFIRMFKTGITAISSKDIIEDIKQKVEGLKHSKIFQRGYTGIAPIPFIVIAGTFLGKEKIDEYFEYDKIDTETYYKLTENKRKKYPILRFQSIPNNIDLLATEAVLAIEITTEIPESDLVQFNNLGIFRLSIDHPKDNTIRFKNQLNHYTNTIFNTLEKQIKQTLPKLKRIHLVYSGQSCLALEIGKRLDNTRICEIISYHYTTHTDVRYPWGIVLNGDNKGKFIDV